jgi:Xaa-Pro aminopeptidase
MTSFKLTGEDKMMAPAHRLVRLRRYLDDHALNAALLTRVEHLRYFAGTPAGGLPGALVVTRDAAVLVAAEGTAATDALEPLGVELCAYAGYDASQLVDRPARLIQALGSIVRRLGVRGHLGTETTYIGHAVVQTVPDAVPQDIGPILAEWRAVKDHAEQALIRQRVAMLDHAFTAVQAAIRPGVSEHDIVGAAYTALLGRVDEPLVLRGNFASGPRTATDNPRPTSRRVAPGDLVLVDLYPVLDGYAADCTRTFVAGSSTALQRERHAVLEAALSAAESRLRPGTEIASVDRGIRDVLRTVGGYDTSMAHHSGHGVGLLAWEEPWIGPDTPGALTEGMTIALEPGLYVPGWGGMRLEGNYLITATGFDRLDRFPSMLTAAAS